MDQQLNYCSKFKLLNVTLININLKKEPVTIIIPETR